MMPVQGNLSVERMCWLAQVSRAGFYRRLQANAPSEEEMEMRVAIQEIVLFHRRRYGYRRVSAELRARGFCVNHKRVARLMREDNLLAIRRRRFVRTTNSDHHYVVHVNLASQLQLTAPDQLWVADLTYVRLRERFVYLAVILDAFSRKVVGWSLQPAMHSGLSLAALEQAIAARRPGPGLVHHSDRGVQYACAEYLDCLLQRGFLPSMSRPGNPYDNAKCESFMKTLKQEEIYADTYRDEQDLRDHITEFIDHYYNRVRLHSALGYCSPSAFEERMPAVMSAPRAIV
jgi:putative transposase